MVGNYHHGMNDLFGVLGIILNADMRSSESRCKSLVHSQYRSFFCSYSWDRGTVIPAILRDGQHCVLLLFRVCYCGGGEGEGGGMVHKTSQHPTLPDETRLFQVTNLFSSQHISDLSLVNSILKCRFYFRLPGRVTWHEEGSEQLTLMKGPKAPQWSPNMNLRQCLWNCCWMPMKIRDMDSCGSMPSGNKLS